MERSGRGAVTFWHPGKRGWPRSLSEVRGPRHKTRPTSLDVGPLVGRLVCRHTNEPIGRYLISESDLRPKSWVRSIPNSRASRPPDSAGSSGQPAHEIRYSGRGHARSRPPQNRVGPALLMRFRGSTSLPQSGSFCFHVTPAKQYEPLALKRFTPRAIGLLIAATACRRQSSATPSAAESLSTANRLAFSR